MVTSSCAELFGARLRDLRNKKELSQQELCSDLGISKAALSYYENGQRVPDIDILLIIADYFNVSADYLLGRTPNKTPNTSKQAVLKYTGLSEAALEEIKYLLEINGEILKVNHNFDLDGVNLLNDIIETDTFNHLILTIIDYCGIYLNYKRNNHLFEEKYREFIVEDNSEYKSMEEEFSEYLLNKKIISLIEQLNSLLDKYFKEFEEKEREENGEHNPPKE